MMKREWEGFWVCESCFEIRQPQDFVRGIPDIQVPPWVQPQPAPTFVDVPQLITIEYVTTDEGSLDYWALALATEEEDPLVTE